VARFEVHPSPLDLERGPAVENEHPLVGVLSVVDGSVEPTTQNLVHDDRAQFGQPVRLFPGCRCGIGAAETTMGDRHLPKIPPNGCFAIATPWGAFVSGVFGETAD